MQLFEVRKDIIINLDAITIVIDRGIVGTQRQVRIHTTDGQHDYMLSNEDFTRFYHKLEEYKCK